MVENSAELIFLATGRVDNRAEAMSRCDASGRSLLTDAACMLAAYRRLGDRAPATMLGDWCFVAWHPRERRLVLARDHMGHTAIYYVADSRVFAFSSCRQELLGWNLVPVEIDELYLAQELTSWMDYHGERTIHRPVRRLPPAHVITVTPDRLSLRRYWCLEEQPVVRLPHRQEYVERWREVVDEAVRARLRVTAGARIGVALSGGLDSGTVAVTAARELSSPPRQLVAFTSVPVAPTEPFVARGSGDERSLATATAARGGIELVPIDAAGIGPIEGLRRALDVHDEPIHAACNAFWIRALLEEARALDCEVLLTGQLGNGGISWTGWASSQPWSYQLRRGWKTAARREARRRAPDAALVAWRRRNTPRDWYKRTAVRGELVARLQLYERRLADPGELIRTPREARLRLLNPGRSSLGAFWAEETAASGVDVRDPTADVRVLAFTLSVPDDVFIDRQSGQNRWLVREAMRDRLPEEVRLNRRMGVQAADIVPRLRATSTQVEEALSEVEHGPGAEYVDVDHLREVWATIRPTDSPDSYRLAVTTLTRGLQAGLWVNRFRAARYDGTTTPEELIASWPPAIDGAGVPEVRRRPS